MWWDQLVAVGARSMATARKHEQHSAATVRATLHPHHASTVQHVKQNAKTESAPKLPVSPTMGIDTAHTRSAYYGCAAAHTTSPSRDRATHRSTRHATVQQP
jgi:hypothetical protein